MAENSMKKIFHRIWDDKNIKNLIKMWMSNLLILLLIDFLFPKVFGAFNEASSVIEYNIVIPIVNKYLHLTYIDLYYKPIEGILVIILFAISISAVIESKNKDCSVEYFRIALIFTVISSIIFYCHFASVIMLLLFIAVFFIIFFIVLWIFILILGGDVVKNIRIDGCLRMFYLNVCILAILTAIFVGILYYNPIYAVSVVILIILLVVLKCMHSKKIMLIYKIIYGAGFFAMFLDIILIATLSNKSDTLGIMWYLNSQNIIKSYPVVLCAFFALYAFCSYIIICCYNLGYKDCDENKNKKYYVQKANLLLNFFGLIIVIVILNCLKFDVLFILGFPKEILELRETLYNFKISLIDIMQVVALVIAYVSMRNEKNLLGYYEDSIKYMHEKLNSIVKKHNITKAINKRKMKKFGEADFKRC